MNVRGGGLWQVVCAMALTGALGCETPAPGDGEAAEQGEVGQGNAAGESPGASDDEPSVDTNADTPSSPTDDPPPADDGATTGGTSNHVVDCTEREFYPDTDGDGHGDESGTPVAACEAPEGHVESHDDCDDTDAQSFAGATEVCDGADNNCDGAVDEGVLLTWHPDADGDGFGDTDGTAVTGCVAPDGYVDDERDCDDSDGRIHPGAAEICDDVDNNCTGEADEFLAVNWYPDTDGDSYGDEQATPVEACRQPSGYVRDNTDCDDSTASRAPSVEEMCDGLDNDCNGLEDDGLLVDYYPDADDDGFGDENAAALRTCETPPTGYVTDNTDCGDDDDERFPGAPARCNNLDDDCDGAIEELRVPLQYATLQDAVDASVNGDLVCLDNGTFVGTTDVGNKAITIQGAPDTRLDGGGTGPVLRATSADGLVLRRLMISGGDAPEGAGVRIQWGNVSLEDVVIEDNECSGACKGTGLFVSAATVDLTDVTLMGNEAVGASGEVVEGAGGHFYYSTITADGLYLYDNSVDAAGWMDGSGYSQHGGTAHISNLVASGNYGTAMSQPRGIAMRVYQGSLNLSGAYISDNETEGSGNAGGPLAFLSSGTSNLDNVFIVDNRVVNASTSMGVAMYAFGHTVNITNSTLSRNSTTAPNTYGMAVHAFPNTTINFLNTDVSNNTGASQYGHVRAQQATITAHYSNFWPNNFNGMTSPVGSDGNLSVDPMYVDDFALDPESPLVNAGDPAISDVDGSRSDIGAFGGPGADV